MQLAEMLLTLLSYQANLKSCFWYALQPFFIYSWTNLR